MSVDAYRAAIAISEYLRVGWLHRLPHSAYCVYEAVVRMEDEGLIGELSAQPLDSKVADTLAFIGGLEADPFAYYERDLLDNHPDDRALLDEMRADLRRAEASVGFPVKTNADLLELLRRLGLVERIQVAGGLSWRPVRPVPLPEERLLLTEKERAREDELRWHREHEQNANLIFCLFNGDDVDVLRSSLNELALRMELPVESVREAVLVLLTGDEYATTAEIARLDPTETFELRIDWACWKQNHSLVYEG